MSADTLFVLVFFDVSPLNLSLSELYAISWWIDITTANKDIAMIENAAQDPYASATSLTSVKYAVKYIAFSGHISTIYNKQTVFSWR